MKRNTKKAFTLVELLAVIVILGLLLVIVVPKVTQTVNNSKKRTLELTARSIAKSAEEKYIENESFGIEEEITCESVSGIPKSDYSLCNISFNEEGFATVTIRGKDRYKGLYICGGTKMNAEVSYESCTLVPLTVELNGGTDNVNYEAKYESGSKVTLDVPTKSGYRLDKWDVTGEGASVLGNELIIGSTATTVTAIWKELVAPNLVIDQELGESSDSPLIIGSSSYTISGTLTAEDGIKSFTINGTEVTVNEDGSWSHTITLTQGTVTEINVVATNNYNVVTSKGGYIKYGTLVGYSYNGTILPKMPINMDSYITEPECIVYCSSGVCYFVRSGASMNGWFADETAGLLWTQMNSYCYELVDGAWTTSYTTYSPSSESGFRTPLSDIIWTYKDIDKKEEDSIWHDGTFMEGTEPVPIYE